MLYWFPFRKWATVPNMVNGQVGLNGVLVQRPVILDPEPEGDHVATPHQHLEEKFALAKILILSSATVCPTAQKLLLLLSSKLTWQVLGFGSHLGQTGLTARQNVAKDSDQGNVFVLEVMDVLICALKNILNVKHHLVQMLWMSRILLLGQGEMTITFNCYSTIAFIWGGRSQKGTGWIIPLL